jgi:hypothetical protein
VIKPSHLPTGREERGMQWPLFIETANDEANYQKSLSTSANLASHSEFLTQTPVTDDDSLGFTFSAGELTFDSQIA